MSSSSQIAGQARWTRRAFVTGASCVAGGALLTRAQAKEVSRAADTSPLSLAAQQSSKTIGVYTVTHELQSDPRAVSIIQNTFALIADGNDLKFSDRLRPAPTQFDFTAGDVAVSWAARNNKLFRGHCLVWWNALPKWFNSYVTPANAKQVMTDHITTVVKHYAGKVYSWDVVNEALYHDNRPDGLRRKPWLDLMGPTYIDIAFQTAHSADPKARLVLNECYVEHDTDGEKARRAQLLALATRLKKSGSPLTTIGLQSHLRGNTPLDKPGMTTFLKQVQDLGLETMVTELDVDDVDVAASSIDQTVAAKYAEYLDLVGPFVKVITFEQVKNDPGTPKRADGVEHRPNLLGDEYQPTPAFAATVKALRAMPRS